MYMPGRVRTCSMPSSTLIMFSVYAPLFFAVEACADEELVSFGSDILMTPFDALSRAENPALNRRENQVFERPELSQKSTVYSMSVESKSLVLHVRFSPTFS